MISSSTIRIDSSPEKILEGYIQAISPELCGQMFVAHLQTGGKRLRAKIVLELARILDIPEEKAILWSSIVEVLHNASLIHDDIQDGDRYRRGQETLWVRYGVPQAINAGDFGLMLPLLLLRELPASPQEKWSLAQAIGEYTTKTIQGQALELSLLDKLCFEYAVYLDAVAGKTGAFFSLPVYGACILAGMSEEKSQQLADAFASIGIIFQLQDDVLDCFGDKGRREIGTDLQEGKISALVIRHLEHKPEDYLSIVRVLRADRGQTSPQAIETIIQDFRTEGGLDDVLNDIMEQIQTVRSCETLREFPEIRHLAMGLIEQIIAPVHHLWSSRV